MHPITIDHAADVYRDILTTSRDFDPYQIDSMVEAFRTQWPRCAFLIERPMVDNGTFASDSTMEPDDAASNLSDTAYCEAFEHLLNFYPL